MTAEDFSDYERFKKKADKYWNAVTMDAEAEGSEFMPPRHFEWQGLPGDARPTNVDFSDRLLEHRNELPRWLPAETGSEAFAATYSFHAILLAVFERQGQRLPRFQRTRGIQRLPAPWVSHAYQEGYRGCHREPLIGPGTAPLEESLLTRQRYLLRIAK